MDPRFERDACGIGMIGHRAGRPSHGLVRRALSLLENLEHRGGRNADGESGDGAGVLLDLPDALLRRDLDGVDLPPAGAYGLAQLFFPPRATAREEASRVVAAVCAEEGVRVLGWRDVPTRPEVLGAVARRDRPLVWQLVVAPAPGEEVGEEPYFRLRRRLERRLEHVDGAYVCSFSSRTVTYKGMMTACQLRAFYPDLEDPALESARALVHVRYSTNTFPSWSLAQPMRMLAHNGEINTLRGNLAWWRARESALRRDAPERLADAGDEPLLTEGGSDSGLLDEAVEWLVRDGLEIDDALTRLVPPAWRRRDDLPGEVRAMYAAQAGLQEPWDGPAALVFTDGLRLGATLDRNGLRPARWVLTDDDELVMASEAGALRVPTEQVRRRGRLGPGQMLLLDPEVGEVLEDAAARAAVASRAPYARWLREGRRTLHAAAPAPPATTLPEDGELLREQLLHGWGKEDVTRVLEPMARDGKPPVGSMGDDTALAVLSERGRSVFDMLKQRFAQVTNPPLDSLRERHVMSLETLLGPEGLPWTRESARDPRITLSSPVVDLEDQARLRRLPGGVDLELGFSAEAGPAGLRRRLEGLARVAVEAVQAGAEHLHLTDRELPSGHAAVPAALAVGAVHHALVRAGLRTRADLLVDSAEVREVHHVAALLGLGADTVHPRLALQVVQTRAVAVEEDAEEAGDNLVRALEKGLRKVMAKMGIAEVQSYRGAALFEALGLDQGLVDRWMPDVPGAIGGADEARLGEEAVERLALARDEEITKLPDQGLYRWRKKGEDRAVTPQALRHLHKAVREDDPEAFDAFVEAVDETGETRRTLRGLLRPRPAGEPVPLEEVEPVDAIVRRFTTGAMSYGSLSQEAHETLALAMNRLGARSNSGEGGEDPARNRVELGGDTRRSRTRQVASGRFGVTSEYLVMADELQIKMAQGAKPGEGGQLPAHKVPPWIARTRHVEPGTELISPPPHHDIYSIEDLAQLIFDLRTANPEAEVSVKLAASAGVGTVAAGVVKAGADRVLVSGADGGTGAAALGSVRHAGTVWELGLARTHQTLGSNGLRRRVRVQVDGGLRTGRDLLVAAALGADEFGFGTAALLATGCIMRRVCHKDTCPVGVATQNPELREKFPGDPEHVVRFMRFVAQDMRRWMARVGVRSVDELVGRTDLLRVDPLAGELGLTLEPLLVPTDGGPGAMPRPERTPSALEERIERAARPAFDEGRRVVHRDRVENTDRTVGTLLGSGVTRRRLRGETPGAVRLELEGSAGQSLGAFVPAGVTLSLTGEANDGVGKGLAGGRLELRPYPGAPEGEVLIGNAALYGATGGQAFVAGAAGERFAVRNSGATAVVEGVGDHGCEYMTGGRVLVLGPIGRNFGAGMRGGVAYVLDEEGDARERIVRDDLEVARVGGRLDELRELLEAHLRATGSPRAARWLADLPRARHAFLRVAPLSAARRNPHRRPLMKPASGAAPERDEPAVSFAV